MIYLHASRIGYHLDWGIGAIFVPLLQGDGDSPWQLKRKRTEKTSQIDIHLGPRGRKFPDAPAFDAAKAELAEPVYQIILGIFKRRIPLPNKAHHLADEAGIRAIVQKGCSAALQAFEPIQRVHDVLALISSGYEKSLAGPPKSKPSYWLTVGIFEIACGNEDRGEILLNQAAQTFGMSLADPILQESIEMARSHFREKAA